MEQLVLQTRSKHSCSHRFFKAEANVFAVGRGLNNALIIDDPFIDAEQLRFVKQGSQWFVQCLASSNPILLNQKLLAAHQSPLNVGDTLTIGQTQIAVLDADQPLIATRKLRIKQWLQTPSWQLILPILAFIAYLIADIAYDYFLSTPARHESKAWMISVLVSAAIAIIWSAIWAFIGRLNHRPLHFLQHLGAYAWVSLLSFVLLPWLAYIEFASSNLSVGEALSYVFAWLVLSLLMRTNLRMASNTQHPSSIAMLLAAILCGSFFVISDTIMTDFDPRPEYSQVLQPGSIHKDSSLGVDEFFIALEPQFAELDRLSEADEESAK